MVFFVHFPPATQTSYPSIVLFDFGEGYARLQASESHIIFPFPSCDLSLVMPYLCFILSGFFLLHPGPPGLVLDYND